MVWGKKLLPICAVGLLAAFGLQATPTVACTTAANYAELKALGSCTLGDKTYSGFKYASTASGEASIPAAEDVIFNTSALDSANGFVFSLPMGAGPGQNQDVSIEYTVTVNTPGKLITSVDVPLLKGSATAPGQARLDETVTGPNGQHLGSLVVSCTTTPCGSTGQLTFMGVTSVTLDKDLIANGGLDTANGFATISLFANFVDEHSTVPEPGFYGVLAGGLAGVFMFAKRRKRTV